MPRGDFRNLLLLAGLGWAGLGWAWVDFIESPLIPHDHCANHFTMISKCIFLDILNFRDFLGHGKKYFFPPKKYFRGDSWAHR